MCVCGRGKWRGDKSLQGGGRDGCGVKGVGVGGAPGNNFPSHLHGWGCDRHPRV